MRVLSRCRHILAALLVAAFVCPALAMPAGGLPQQEFAMDLTMEGGDAPMTMRLWAGVGPVRMDMTGEMGQVSMIWTESAMIMVMHQQRSYMEFTKEMLDGMRQMMGRMGQEESAEPDFDVTEWSFETTGATDTIHGMNAFEVRMTGPEGKTGSLWMTEDTDIGLFEGFARLGETFESMGMPGRRNPMQRLREYTFYARAQGLPEGRVIRVVDGESGTVITVGDVDKGPFAADTWSAPAGYTKQQMPMMPR